MKGGMLMIIALITGALAGWMAGNLMDSDGSLLRNIILGLLGGIVGRFILKAVGIYSYGFIGDIIVAVIGACLLIYLARKLDN